MAKSLLTEVIASYFSVIYYSPKSQPYVVLSDLRYFVLKASVTSVISCMILSKKRKSLPSGALTFSIRCAIIKSIVADGRAILIVEIACAFVMLVSQRML